MNKYSSRRDDVFSSLLNKRLKDAISYDRIAGYFSSSLLEIAGETIEQMDGKIRIICNSDLDIDDVKTAQLAVNAIRKEWCDFKPEEILCDGKNRFEKLYNLLQSQKVEIKVLPRECFGLVHGKAGVITMKDGYQTAFLGSINESFSGWKLNYELVWEDDTKESVDWVQEEFDTLWKNPYAVDIKQVKYVVDDIKRISKRIEVTCDRWKERPNAGAAVVESPVYRTGFGLWDHQKYFVNKVFHDHIKKYGARYVLADQVGLGKTVQLALSAQLAALYGDRPILIIVPKTLVVQWQDELNTLLDMPSAIWVGKWIDEIGNEYMNDITHCPRRIGIISQGILINGSESCREIQNQLLIGNYEMVICDEAHRARRANLGENKEYQSPEMNNLYKFLFEISPKTKSMLLATATPVQMYPIEAFDLLNILSQKNDSVLGSLTSFWRNRNKIPDSLKYISGEKTLNEEEIYEYWEWIRNPMPPADEKNKDFMAIRSAFDMDEEDFVAQKTISDMSGSTKSRLQDLIDNNFFQNANPYIRHIIRRERAALENRKNPETGLPYLQPIKVVLFGEDAGGILTLSGYLKDAYLRAEEFCEMLKERSRAAGFMKTLLLKRIGSSMISGYLTGQKMLKEWGDGNIYDEDDDEEISFDLKDLTLEERKKLEEFVNILGVALESNNRIDPKYNKVIDILNKGVTTENGVSTGPWKDLGCIIFTQYYDTAEWVAKNISEDYVGEIIGVYAGSDKSCVFIDGIPKKETRDNIKKMVKEKKLKIIVGTDAASEGLNLQSLGTLINLDLPWNPTRLEQRKGRIQRIGQVNDTIYLYNLRYKDSVEDRVHSLLSVRLKSIYNLFGQLPDMLSDVWIDVALNNIDEANKQIGNIPDKHPFDVRYNDNVATIEWEKCEEVLNNIEIKKILMKRWK
ncbi:phospholipase D-like domain-containing anti-phage protein [Anaerocolumna sedimenticola]|nr:phospholipase D-like domain-containing anti-phage protein [Anaerocolumna sedimenticola]